MPKYKVILKETYIVTYEINALDEKEAISEAFSCQGEVDRLPLNIEVDSPVEEIK
jgi:hypothetical protein